MDDKINIDELINKNKEEISKICDVLKFLDDKKNFLGKQIKDYELRRSKKLKVTDHAIVQYFRRVLDFDIDEIEKEILKDDLQTRYETLGDQTYDQKNFRAIVNNNTVITIMKPK